MRITMSKTETAITPSRVRVLTRPRFVFGSAPKSKVASTLPRKTLSTRSPAAQSIPSDSREEVSMGLEARTANDRLRTVWTPEMDRYFINLMLEQVSRGNRIDDNLFSKRAWKHMLMLFNAKFKSNYEKDVLKNRHKSLRNLYRGIRNLLDQTGFYWDETRQMVTAENNVWDEYIKAHPDARSYRIKSIPYYRDLCLIYGNSSCKQKANVESESEMSSHSLDAEIVAPINPDGITDGSMDSLNDIAIDEDFSISLPDGVSGAPLNVRTSTSSRTRTYWEPPMDRYFIDLMMDQMRRCNQVDGIFVKQAWSEMIDSFNAKFGFGYEVDVLKNRYKTLRRQYNVIRNLLELDGFSWDDSRQMVIADDYVWQDYIKAHTDARQFMTRPVPYYKDLCMICRDLSADDRELLLARSVDEPRAEDQQASKECPSSSPSNPGEEQRDSSEVPLKTSSRKHSLDQDDQERQEKRFNGTPISVTPLLDVRKEDEGQNSIPVEAVVEAVQALPDMDDELILDACDFLEDDNKAKTFMALGVKLRKKWLIRKLRPDL
ncbi:L10-interacting MYB domain-containing protein-like isoform X1 [Punica granatum]|uniref:L10-interacting MYB domain-containing protein-like isoform X1 n=3 Tax=Punica granatum TaxID=22663 RepID=A0A6P8ECE2_PUNGR|nr:L10-interacting MYB domain-containing protein-like isoform X1 [Punica granatum]